MLRALLVLRIVLSVRFSRPVAWLKVSQIERATRFYEALRHELEESSIDDAKLAALTAASGRCERIAAASINSTALLNQLKKAVAVLQADTDTLPPPPRARPVLRVIDGGLSSTTLADFSRARDSQLRFLILTAIHREGHRFGVLAKRARRDSKSHARLKRSYEQRCSVLSLFCSFSCLSRRQDTVQQPL